MKRFLLMLFLVLGLSLRASAQSTATLTAAATTCTFTGAGCLVNSISQVYGGATFTVTANASGNTIQFEASGDGGTTWVALSVTPSNSSTAVTSTTSTGTWQANIAAYTHARMRMSTLVGGTTTVQINLSNASARSGGGGGGGGNLAAPNDTNITYVRAACGGLANCFQINRQVVNDVDPTFTSSSTSITTSANVPAFTCPSAFPCSSGGDAGDVEWGTSNCLSINEASCTNNCPQGTITTVNSAHNVTVSLACVNNSSATAHSNRFIYGKDDAAQLAAAFNSLFPAGANSTQPLTLDLPGGSMMMCSPSFVSPTLSPRTWPIIVQGHNSTIFPCPKMNCPSPIAGVGCLLSDNHYAQDALGNLGMADHFYDMTFDGGGTSAPDGAAVYANPAYGISCSLFCNLNNVWVWAWNWNSPSANPIYGIFCQACTQVGSGSYAGGNFGEFAQDLNGAPATIVGGNLGGSNWNSLVISPTATSAGVTTVGLYTNQPQCGAFANKLCYGVYQNGGIWHDTGSYVSLWQDSGTSWLTNTRLSGFSSIYTFDLAGGSLYMNQVSIANNCNQTGGSLFDDGGNAPWPCPSGTFSGGTIFGSASITGTSAVAGNWALSGGWGTTAAVTAITGRTQRTRYTVTASGTGQGANPTITHTFASAFAAAPICSIKQDGGTQAAVANPFTVGTPVAASVVYTYTGTPGAANTLILEEDCSNP